ncbi:hypothetical protein B0H19DRAFT_1187271, partial [Mycena capillaripes]
PSADPAEKRKGNGHGGKRPGAGRPRSGPDPGPVAKTQVLGQPLRQACPQHSHGLTLHPFFGPYNTHQPVPLVSPVSPLVQSRRGSLWSTVGTSTSGAASQLHQIHISLGNFTQLNDQLDYIEEHDEHGDIATGDQLIDDSLVDEVWTLPRQMRLQQRLKHIPRGSNGFCLTKKHLLSLRKRLSAEIQKYGSPCAIDRVISMTKLCTQYSRFNAASTRLSCIHGMFLYGCQIYFRAAPIDSSAPVASH